MHYGGNNQKITFYYKDEEILTAWLTELHFEEYYHLFVSAGYDMPTISR